MAMFDAKLDIKKDIEKQMIRLLDQNAKGLVLVAELNGNTAFIVHEHINNHEKFSEELLDLIKKYAKKS